LGQHFLPSPADFEGGTSFVGFWSKKPLGFSMMLMKRAAELNSGNFLMSCAEASISAADKGSNG